MASAQSSVQIEGLEPLLKTLAALPAATALNILRPALETAGGMLAAATRMHAMKVLRDAESKGYQRKTGRHLYESANTRVKMYRKGATASGSGQGGTVFVAAGFALKQGGYHGHLVEMGHRVVKGGSIETSPERDEFGKITRRGHSAAITAAGRRWLESHGYQKGNYRIWSLGRRGRRKITAKGAWLDTTNAVYVKDKRGKLRMVKGTGTVIAAKDVTNKRFGAQLRGGGRVLTDAAGSERMTKPRPMLALAWAELKSPIVSMLELQFSLGIHSEAVRVALENNVKQGYGQP